MARADRDTHAALRQDVVSKVNRDYLEVAVARLQWSKDEVGYSLHVNPTLVGTSNALDAPTILCERR